MGLPAWVDNDEKPLVSDWLAFVWPVSPADQPGAVLPWVGIHGCRWPGPPLSGLRLQGIYAEGSFDQKLPWNNQFIKSINTNQEDWKKVVVARL